MIVALLLIAGALPLRAETLSDRLTSSDEGTRKSAMAELKAADRSTKEALSVELGRIMSQEYKTSIWPEPHKFNDKTARAAQALGGIGAAAIPELLRLVAGGFPYYGASDCVPLGIAFKAIGKEAAGPLVDNLSRIERAPVEEYAKMTGTACTAEYLAAIGEDALPELLRGLGRDDQRTRLGVARALGLLGPKALSAVPGLLKNLDDKNWDVRVKTLEALAAIGPSALPDLKKAYSEAPVADGNRRRDIEDAIKKIEDATKQAETLAAFKKSVSGAAGKPSDYVGRYEWRWSAQEDKAAARVDIWLQGGRLAGIYQAYDANGGEGASYFAVKIKEFVLEPEGGIRLRTDTNFYLNEPDKVMATLKAGGEGLKNGEVYLRGKLVGKDLELHCAEKERWGCQRETILFRRAGNKAR
ncbi:MAG TPA: HEAT repeat domain-containing protein [Elusimicrobiota bacterium]|jgi:hypothetical protein|nr:HEAT repeat domain-containing protein [Elusimicrobiota bacterium]